MDREELIKKYIAGSLSEQELEVFQIKLIAEQKDREATEAQQQKVADYIAYVKAKSEVERQQEKEVTGEFIGAYAINPFTNTKIPIWIGEYVLKDYGTGAIMAVPSDDERDNRFATKFGLEIIDVVDKSKYPGATLHDKVGIIKNSGFLDGMEVPDAITAAEPGAWKAVSAS